MPTYTEGILLRKLKASQPEPEDGPSSGRCHWTYFDPRMSALLPTNLDSNTIMPSVALLWNIQRRQELD